MMPLCEYKGCNRVVDTTESELLRKWESYDFRTASNHIQEICLCEKHRKKIYKLLGVSEAQQEEV